MKALESLTSKGWKKENAIPFREQIVKDAKECYSYSNAKNTQIALMPFTDQSVLTIRLAGTRGNNFNYFQIKIDATNEQLVVDKIDSIKDEVDINNYFNVYFGLQAVGEVAIMAWEQWEVNYR